MKKARRKAITASREEVLAMWEGGMSQRAIAEHFGCSRTTVHWLLHPDRYEDQLERHRVHKQLHCKREKAERSPDPAKPRKRQLIRYAGWEICAAKW